MVTNIISQERLTKYLKAAGFDQTRALALYGWNIQLSEAFFPVLSASEVCLRNIISQRLVTLYGQNWWDDAAFLLQIKDGGKRTVLTARDKLNKRGALSSGGMTAELNFGFWVNMLLPRHEPVFWQDLHSNFSDLPAAVSYDRLYKRCDEVREFRNRVFHHEPILHMNITKEYSQIMELIGWLSADKAKWIKPYSRVMAVARQKP
ncbi:Abi family protein [Phaeobacter inhibens]|uniref:Abi family protein n=1 Tax=Phaeobacter inhibens TaxID=221822 RepID=UPI000C998582|nr:Abi family protein [Phaeobacter inhibens]AUQ63194.1 Abi-like protein [Phaeobacter inhibens]AUQ83098.1 Abi-like protein [Phaeobacter inhibens]AUQ90859.1 Abi-like protein [Phaeobacter inhibens]MDO6757609.1 Abi family protein [Phaeobacter inhibens]